MQLNHQKDLRKGRYSQKNQIYHITFTTVGRQLIFKDFANARTLINILKQSDRSEKTSTLAFVVMLGHVHWLMQLVGHQSLANTIKAIKSKTTIQIGYQIWQKGYYDHAIRKDEDIQGVARCIVASPIRAGIVERVGDYPHWDAIWL